MFKKKLEKSILFKTLYNSNQLNKITNLNPILELYNGKIYSNILKSFINICIRLLGKKIFSIKKSYPRTLTNLLSSWLFSLYSYYDFSDNYFLPSNFHYTKQLEVTLIDFCKYDETILNKEEKISKIIEKLHSVYQYGLNSIKMYENSDYYKNNSKSYKIIKNKIVQKRKHSDKEIFFYKLEIKKKIYIRDNRLFNILDNILLPVTVYDKLKNKYTGPENKLDEYIWIILYRYQLLGSNNHQLGVLPTILKQMKKDFGLNFECFASAINSTLDSFCSIYYDVEKYFGSKGSFFNLEPLEGVFGFNPPYQNDIIERGIKLLFHHLDKSSIINKKLTFIITIPIWDSFGQSLMDKKYNNKSITKIDYGEFTIIEDIKTSKYFGGLRMIPKEEFTYLDHNFHLYKNVTIQNTYIIVLTNDKENNYIEQIKQYKFQI